MLFLALLACSGASPTPGSLPEVDCAPQADNALRVDCTTDRAVRFEATDGTDTRVVEAEAGHFTISGIQAGSRWTWTADGSSGSFEAGPLPSTLPTVSATGTSSAPHTVFAAGPWVVILDGSGQIVWYQAFEEGWTQAGGVVTGFDLTPEGSVLAVANSVIRELDLDGTERLRIEREDRPLHHDVHRAKGLTWALNASVRSHPSGNYVYDGLYVYDAAGDRVASWDLADHLPDDPQLDEEPTTFWSQEFPGALDVAHTNSVFVADDGAVLLSLRRHDAIWALEGLESGAFGELRWIFGGPDGDFAVSAPPGTEPLLDGQHHARLEGNRLTAFDNRVGANARTVAYDLDVAGRTAELVQAIDLIASCSIQGAHHALPNGNLLATCGEQKWFVELDPTGEVLWEVHVGGPAPWVPRAIPVNDPLW